MSTIDLPSELPEEGKSQARRSRAATLAALVEDSVRWVPVGFHEEPLFEAFPETKVAQELVPEDPFASPLSEEPAARRVRSHVPSEALLSELTFVVVDLESTGASARECDITEIGAVKVRAGEVLGEFQTFVRPAGSIPSFITALTGITDSMVAHAPDPAAALASFWEFAQGCVIVAHNAPFDTGFLKTVGARVGVPWPGAPVLDTLTLARKIVVREESPNHKLSSLARWAGSPTAPDHRALTDARATVDVLHALFARVGGHGMHTWGAIQQLTTVVTPAIRRKRGIADHLPAEPGVYLFRDHAGRILYIGTSVDVAKRVRSYFTRAEKRARMRDMLLATDRVDAIVCATPAEAHIRELRLIAEHRPPYNRRSTRPEQATWIALTREPYPRLSVVRSPNLSTSGPLALLGPFSGAGSARLARLALEDATGIRECIPRLPLVPSAQASACLALDLGRCQAPCVDPNAGEAYAAVVQRVRRCMSEDASDIFEHSMARADALAAGLRFEEAADARDRLSSFLNGAARSQRQAVLRSIPELMAARPRPQGGWEVMCIRYSRLAGVALTPRGRDPMPMIEALRATAEAVPEPGQERSLPAYPEEVDLLWRWLDRPGVRLVSVDGTFALPIRGAEFTRQKFLARTQPVGSGTPEPSTPEPSTTESGNIEPRTPEPGTTGGD